MRENGRDDGRSAVALGEEVAAKGELRLLRQSERANLSGTR